MSRKNKKQTRGISWASLRAEWWAWWLAKAPVLSFGAKFGGLVVLLYILLAIPWAEQKLYFYLKINAWVSSGILNLLGQGTHVSDVYIRSPSFSIAIRRGCDAVEPTWLLCAAILAFPGPWSRKLAGMLVGIVALQVLNIVRIVTLYIIGSSFPHSPGLFSSVHVEIWPALFIIAAIGLFVGWKGWAHAK